MNVNAVVLAESRFLAFDPRGADAREAMQETMEGGTLSIFDLDSIRVPAGGATSFEVETLDGEESVKELRGVVIAMQSSRSYWKSEFGSAGGNERPDCSSVDAIVGEGNPGGVCDSCPMNEFETRGHGKACKINFNLFMLFEDCLLPSLIVLPSSSHKIAVKHFRRMTSRGIMPSSVVTEISLERVQSLDGIAYSRVKLRSGSKIGALSAEEIRAAAEYSRQLAPALIRSS